MINKNKVEIKSIVPNAHILDKHKGELKSPLNKAVLIHDLKVTMEEQKMNYSEEEMRNIGECLLKCINRAEYEGEFDCEYRNGEKQWEYKKGAYLMKAVCNLFGLNIDLVEEYGYTKDGANE